MNLEYGNFFFQKLIKRLNQIIEPDFSSIASNKSRTNSIQSLTDEIWIPFEQFELDKLLNNNTLIFLMIKMCII